MTNTIDRSVLDEDVRFSRTHMWRMQRAFYETSGVKCWQDLIVPNFISSNTFLAHAYARCVLAFLLDHYATADAAVSTQPVHIIEIGSGAGKFSYVLLHKLLALRKHWPRTQHGGLPFTYIITDCTRSSVPFYLGHSRLQPLFEQGLLDCACYDAETGGPLMLEYSKQSIDLVLSSTASTDIANTLYLCLSVNNNTATAGSLQQPVVCVANYVFDSLQQDAFRVTASTQGRAQLEELLCTVTAAGASPAQLVGPAAGGPELLRFMRCSSIISHSQQFCWLLAAAAAAAAASLPVAVTDVHSYYEEADVAAVLEALRQTCCASSADTSVDGASPATPAVTA
eukprot:12408-Heterococcus_DN1.PRE.2